MVYTGYLPAAYPDKTRPMCLQVFHNLLGNSVNKRHVLYLANKRGRNCYILSFLYCLII